VPSKRLQKRGFRRGRLSEQVVAELEKMIAEHYPAGECLPKESELAERFHVSRIVIREAIKILEGRGLVEARAGSGTYTTPPSIDKVKESLLRLFKDQPIPSLADMELMLELREVLEETAASLAAVRATPGDLAEMEAALIDMESGEDGPESVGADLRFHQAVAKAAHNRFYEMVLEPLTAIFMQQMMLTNAYQVGADLHRAVAEEIRKGSSVGARQAVRRLMRRTLQHTRKALEVIQAAAPEDVGAGAPK
jgi:DNA-binding FadR family transcriptional regulator